jgi:hypothetical protein
MGEVMRVLATKAPVAVILVLTFHGRAVRPCEAPGRLIEAKVAGQEIVAQPVHEPAPIINLMDAQRLKARRRHREDGPQRREGEAVSEEEEFMSPALPGPWATSASPPQPSVLPAAS